MVFRIWLGMMFRFCSCWLLIIVIVLLSRLFGVVLKLLVISVIVVISISRFVLKLDRIVCVWLRWWFLSVNRCLICWFVDRFDENRFLFVLCVNWIRM